VRVVLADPPAYTPSYDHELAAALGRAGADVELVTSPFRFGAVDPPDGYRRRDLFYPWSTRLFRRSRLRLPVKLVEHPVGMARLARRARRAADVVHVQWLAVPELDRALLRLRVPIVFTAHDLLPRRTAHKLRLWRELYARFDRVVVHSERGRQTLEEVGVAPERLRVIPQPVYPRDVARRDDGRTLLFFGIIRPYRGLPDALAAVRRVEGARLIVAGDPVEPVDRYRAEAGDAVDWRLGYLSEADVDRAHGEATLALFPYRPEIDQSASLLRALGSGVPAVAYDVGGIAEPVRAFGAGRVVAPGDVEAFAAAIRELLDDDEALAAARAGAERARAELTWGAAAEAHLALYRELL
jgi:glycosyltransferase involved in cell wall biosynthesis